MHPLSCENVVAPFNSTSRSTSGPYLNLLRLEGVPWLEVGDLITNLVTALFVDQPLALLRFVNYTPECIGTAN